MNAIKDFDCFPTLAGKLFIKLPWRLHLESKNKPHAIFLFPLVHEAVVLDPWNHGVLDKLNRFIVVGLMNVEEEHAPSMKLDNTLWRHRFFFFLRKKKGEQSSFFIFSSFSRLDEKT